MARATSEYITAAAACHRQAKRHAINAYLALVGAGLLECRGAAGFRFIEGGCVGVGLVITGVGVGSIPGVPIASRTVRSERAQGFNARTPDGRFWMAVTALLWSEKGPWTNTYQCFPSRLVANQAIRSCRPCPAIKRLSAARSCVPNSCRTNSVGG
jgi:hypothetical protein